MTIIYVSHFLEEVLALSDDITVLRNGRLDPHGPGVGRDRGDARQRDARPCGIGGLPAAQAASPGATPVGGRRPEPGRVPARRVAHRRGAARSSGWPGSSAAAAQSSHARSSGPTPSTKARSRSTARSWAPGRRAGPSRPAWRCCPRAARSRGCCCTAGRGEHDLPFLGSSRRIARFGWLWKGNERDDVRTLLADLAVKPESPNAMVKTMSGGNQQKVLFGKCLFRSRGS